MISAFSFPLTALDWLLAGGAFFLGLCVGSFLNVVIYRVPLGLSVNEPKRSFCPHCKTPIKAWHNLPVLGWLWLRGKCASCGAGISIRYPLVEVLTGILFLAVWLACWPADPWLALPLSVLVSILIAATFIDLDHLIIPDGLTWGGVVAGVGFSMLFPALHGLQHWWDSMLWSAIGAVSGYLLLWGVVEMGKLAFGRKKIAFANPAKFSWRHAGEEDAELVIDGEVEKWSELFSRESDRLELTCDHVEIADRRFEDVTLTCYYNRLDLPGASYPLSVVEAFSGVVRSAVVPREAMGFGDVKFLAAIGAFLGWKAVLFAVASGSLIGSVLGLATVPLTRGAQGLRLPFGPFLAAGALIWILAGRLLLDWYLGLMRG